MIENTIPKRLNQPFMLTLDFDNLRQTLHASIQDRISSTDVGGNVVEASGGGFEIVVRQALCI